MKPDVLIVGSGPAGASTALSLLRQGVAVTVLTADKSSLGIPVDVLSPDVKPEFAAIGIQNKRFIDLGVACYGIDAAWGGAQPVLYSFLHHPHGDGVAIQRSDLHGLLLQCVTDAGTHHRAGRFVGAERISKGWRVTLQHGEITEQVECRVLVDATGRASVISRYMGARFKRYDSLCCIAALLDDCKKDRVLAVSSTAYGWWYATAAPGDCALVCLVSDADVVRHLAATRPDIWLALLRPIAPALSLSELPQRIRLATYPCESAVVEAMGADWIAVGDSAARFDPLAATGVLHAIRSGRSASEAITSYLRGNDSALIDFARGEVKVFDAYLSERQRQYGLEGRFSQHTFWTRRTAASGRPTGAE